MKRKFISLLLLGGILIPNLSIAQSFSGSDFESIKKVMVEYYAKRAQAEKNDSINWSNINCNVSVGMVHSQRCINAKVSYVVYKDGKAYEHHSKNWWFDKKNNRYAWLSDFRRNEPYGHMPSTSFTSGGYGWRSVETQDTVVTNIFRYIIIDK